MPAVLFCTRRALEHCGVVACTLDPAAGRPDIDKLLNRMSRCPTPFCSKVRPPLTPRCPHVCGLPLPLPCAALWGRSSVLGMHEGSALRLALMLSVANGSLVQVRLLRPATCAPLLPPSI